MSRNVPAVEVSTLPPPNRRRGAIRVARAIALVADVVQWIFLPLFAPGIASPIDDAMDIVVGLVMVWLIGWHIAFLPAFVVEALPFGDLAPSWTVAVWIATRGKGVGQGKLMPG